MIDAATALAFSVFENPGVFAVLMGSGLSRAAEIPTGWEITLSLVERVAALEGAGEQADLVAWHQKRFGEPPSYSKLLDDLSQTPDERRAIIHGFIEPTAEDLAEGRKVPTDAHRAIARLVRDGFIRVIVTTNFDRLMENALRDEGVEPVVVKSNDDLAGTTPLIHTRCFILKVHGDYLDTRLRNTEGELSTYSEAQDRCLDRIFDEHGLIVCGWSAEWDDALRAAIMRTTSRRYPLFWASRGEPGAFAQDIISHRAGRLIKIDGADGLFGRLQRDIETQAALKRPNPLSVQLMVASAKRYLAKPEHRIQLSDLVTDEVRRARRLVAEGEFSMNGGRAEYAEFRRRVAAYEAIHEGLIRMLYTMGRWGSGEEFGLATEILKSLAASPERNGLVIWIGLQSYPGVLALYAYGLGLLKAERLRDLHRWLVTMLREAHTDPKAAVEMLLLWAWAGNDEGSWRSFDGYDRRKTPLSDYLLSRFQVWFREDFSSQRDLQVAFETFETFASLAHIGRSATTASLRESLDTTDRFKVIWTPIGRIGWNDEDKAEVLAAVFGDDREAAVMTAGFAHGDPEFLSLAADNFKRMFNDMRFMRI